MLFLHVYVQCTSLYRYVHARVRVYVHLSNDPYRKRCFLRVVCPVVFLPRLFVLAYTSVFLFFFFFFSLTHLELDEDFPVSSLLWTFFFSACFFSSFLSFKSSLRSLLHLFGRRTMARKRRIFSVVRPPCLLSDELPSSFCSFLLHAKPLRHSERREEKKSVEFSPAAHSKTTGRKRRTAGIRGSSFSSVLSFTCGLFCTYTWRGRGVSV